MYRTLRAPGRVVASLTRAYGVLALLTFNTIVIFLSLNLVAWAGLTMVRMLVPPPNAVEEKYGAEALARVYPGTPGPDIRALLDETWSLQRGFQPYVQFREAPFKGRFVNVDPTGFRHSADQAPWPPPRSAVSVFFFGGSTAFAYGLPDADTVPSQLQRALKRRGYGNVAVYNFGAGSYQSTQEKIHFQELLVRGTVPDLAIFMDGLNEFAFPHVPQDTDLLARSLNERGLSAARLAAIAANLPITELAHALVPAIPLAGASGATTVDDAESRTFVEGVASRYLANVRQTAAIARAAGVTPVFVWQPTPYFEYDTSHHAFYDPGGVNRYAAAGYLHMKARVQHDTPPATFLWAADIQRELREPLYVDSVHYTAAMAGRLADWIAARLDESGLVPKAGPEDR